MAVHDETRYPPMAIHLIKNLGGPSSEAARTGCVSPHREDTNQHR